MVREAEKELENRNWESSTLRFMSPKVTACLCMPPGPVFEAGWVWVQKDQSSQKLASVKFPSLTDTLFVL